MEKQDLFAFFAHTAGVRFGEVKYRTIVRTASAHKALTVEKFVTANIRLFGSIKDFEIYRKAIERETGKPFVVSDTYYRHPDPSVWSYVEHRESRQAYLYGVIQSARAILKIDGREATRKEVLALLTPSERDKWERDPSESHNLTNWVTHHQAPRVIKLENVLELR